MPIMDSYVNLITSQNRGCEKFVRTVEALLTPSEDIFSLAVYLDDEYDLNYATGVQEDTLGVLVGANRVLEYQPEKGVSPVLDNAAYRNLLRADCKKPMERRYLRHQGAVEYALWQRYHHPG